MLLRSIFGILLTLCFSPQFTHAKESLEWEITSQNFPGQWELRGNAEVVPQQNGLLIITRGDTTIGRPLEKHRGLDTVTLKYKIAEQLEAKFFWKVNIGGKSVRAKVPVFFGHSSQISTTEMNMSRYANWDRQPTYIGLEIPAGRQILLLSIELQGYNLFEKIIEGIKSYWHMDQMRPSAINFLWGPHFTTNPIATKQMFLLIPPRAHSANWHFYWIILLITGYLTWKVKKRRMSKERAINIVCCSVLILWMLFDLRMGLEYIGYAKTDYIDYWSKPIGQRTFRNRLYFNDFAESVAGFLVNERAYKFAASEESAYSGLMRYYTYPAIPMLPDQEQKDIDTWVLYQRPDFTMNDNGELVQKGRVLTPSGSVLHEYAPGSFIFRTNP